MKRTCAYCRNIYDDGKPYPKNCLGDFKDPTKNHGICPSCVPDVEAETDRYLAVQKIKGDKIVWSKK